MPIEGVAGRPARKSLASPTVAAEWLEPRTLLAAGLLAELNPGTKTSQAAGNAPIGHTTDRIYALANDGVHGDELWSSDGTAAGTRILGDLTPGPGSTVVASMAPAGGLMYFDRAVNSARYELWRSDGTAAGTFRVAETGNTPTRAAYLPLDGRLYFTAAAPGGGYGVYSTDGTADGTRLLRLSTTVPGPLVATDDLLLYVVGGVPGGTLYRFDGTTDTALASALAIRSMAAAPGYAVLERNNDIGVSVVNTTTGELFRNTSASSPHGFWRVGDRVGFVGSNAPWITDGTPAGTRPITSAEGLLRSDSSGFAAFNGDVYFGATAASRSGLWKIPGGGGFQAVRVTDAYVQLFSRTPFADRLYFSNRDSAHGTELWRTDGTATGTELAFDVNPNRATADPYGMAVIGGKLVFSAVSPRYGRELFATDGTGYELVYDVNQIPAGAVIRPTGSRGAALLGGRLFFAANGVADGAGDELWVTDGTPAGTGLVKDLVPGPGGSEPYWLTAFDGSVYFTTLDGRLWRTDGTDAGTGAFSIDGVESITEVGGTLFVGTKSSGLWVVGRLGPGEVVSRELLADGRRLYGVTAPAAVGGELFFVADDHVGGGKVWRSDGTDAGTRAVTALSLPAAPLPVRDAVASDGRYFFLKEGSGLWASDGTAAGTSMVRAVDYDPSHDIDALAAAGGLVYFAPYAAGTLLRSDGTEAGTFFLRSGTFEGYGVRELTPLGRELLFTAKTSAGLELWKTDGTDAGTVLLKDINPGVEAGSEPTRLEAFGDLVVFSADDGVHGRELWQTDGTTAGTILVADLFAGPSGSDPDPLARAGGRVYFAATSPETERALFYADLATRPTPAAVVGRHVFYNNSALDGRDAGAGVADDNAIDFNKLALPGGAGGGTFANVTGSASGINGVMIDIAGLPPGAALAGEDFDLRTGLAGDPGGWAPAPAPASITVRRLGEGSGVSRVTLTFTDGAIRNTWLRVTLRADEHTGLAQPDLFLFGNLAGETGDPRSPLRVGPLDLLAVRRNFAPSSPGSPYDLNHDGAVNALDLGVVRSNLMHGLRAVPTPPPVPSPTAVEGERARDEAIVGLLR